MRIHKSVRDFALKHELRIRRDDTGAYTLVGPGGRAIDAPLQKGSETTAKGALAMLRRHVRGKNVIELSRVRKVLGLWVVQVLSAATGGWIVVSEWRTETEAKADLKNWRRSNPSGTSKFTAAQKVKVRRVVRKLAKRSRNPRAGAKNFARAVKLYTDFHGTHPRFVDEYELPAPDVGVYVGPCDGILYSAKVNGKTERLVHEFTGKSRPIFAVSADGRDILLLGGDFQFTERGLVDGI